MPYDNAYNRKIADDIMAMNKKYLEHEKLTGQSLSGGFLGTLAGMILPTVVSSISDKIFGSGMSAGSCECERDESECECGAGMSGGSGFGAGTFMDTGFERTIGAGISAGAKRYVKKKSNMGCAGGAKKTIKGKGVVGDLVGTVGMGASGGKKRGRKPKASMQGEGVLSSVGNVLDDLFGFGASGGKKRGRKPKAKMTGGTELGLPVSIAGAGMSAGAKKRGRKPKATMQGEGLLSGIGGVVDDLFGFGSSGGKKKVGRKSKMAGGVKLVPVANMKASFMAGQGKPKKSAGKKPNKRAEVVKKVMAEKGLSMIEASKYVKAHNLYK